MSVTNTTESADFLKVLLTLKSNIMNSLSVADLYIVDNIESDKYYITNINNNNERIIAIKLDSLTININDVVLVIFTNTDFRINLKRIKENTTQQNVDDTILHTKNNAIIIGKI